MTPPSPSPSEEPFSLQRQPASRERMAAVDIGSNSVRIVVAQATDAGYQVLDEERENTRLAASLGETGRLSDQAVNDSIAALRGFMTLAEGHRVGTVRAIATSAVRDAENGGEFCQRVLEETGLQVEVIPPHEEGRLAFLSVARAFDVSDKAVAVADIGGGSTEIVMAVEGVIEEVYATRLGAVTVAEACGLSGRCNGGPLAKAAEYVDSELRRHVGKPPVTPSMLYGAGGTFTALASLLLAADNPADDRSVRGYRANRARVRHLVSDLARMSLDQRAKAPGLSPRRADIIVAGLLVIERILKHFHVNEVQVHAGGVRDGLLLTMVRGARDTDRVSTGERREAVERFADRCHVDLPHARQVARIAARLLEELAEPLGIDPADKPLLEAAALLSNVGYLINFDGHHKHSYHLILNSDLPGFERDELRVLANVARYHRGARPKSKHKPYAALSEEDRLRVDRLAAILRVALALDRTHRQHVRDVRAIVSKKTVEITVHAEGDPEGDLWAARRKAGLFERVFARSVYFAAGRAC